MELRVICIVAQCIVSATALKFEATRRAPTRRAPTRETRRYHQGHAHDFSDHEYRGSTMRLLSEVKAVDVDKWLSAQKDEAVCGVYALYDGGACVFVGCGEDAVGAVRAVRDELGRPPDSGVSLKFEGYEPDQQGLLSLMYASWLDEASPDGERPRVNVARAAARAAERGF
mmetsp:Transcript_34674/g.104507  ORF Transcript_34674/g.104507 Transcript_34674/m.104507 type:complete len:171 (-) Transcript_34674:6-518(-)